jgi:uncharacterized protein YndB with AHSA1/START domain/DNA-binding transcriptional ArsR family regulator
MVEQDLDIALTAVLKAASDPTRRRVLTLLAQHGPMRVTDLARHFQMSLNSVSKHIKTLESAGLVSRRTQWREHLIELQTDRMTLIDTWFAELRSIWDMRLEKLDNLISKETDMTTDTELKLETSRVIAASPEVLFDAWLDPEMLARFMTPMQGVLVPEAKADARVGGRFLVVMRVDDKDLPHAGTYKTIDRPNELAFTWESPMSPIEDSTVTLKFAPVEGGTKVSLRHVRFPSEESRANHEKGWAAILEALSKAV